VFEAYKTDQKPKQSKREYDRESANFFFYKGSKQRDQKQTEYYFRSTDINEVWKWLKMKKETKVNALKSSISTEQRWLEKEEILL
jgi:hypothetical protein